MRRNYLFLAISVILAITAITVSCTSVERQQVLNDTLEQVTTTVPEAIASNPTPWGVILAIVGAGVVVFNKSARRNFGRVAKGAITKPVGWLGKLAAILPGIVSLVRGLFVKKEPPKDG
jgi:hypothetical protein